MHTFVSHLLSPEYPYRDDIDYCIDVPQPSMSSSVKIFAQYDNKILLYTTQEQHRKKVLILTVLSLHDLGIEKIPDNCTIWDCHSGIDAITRKLSPNPRFSIPSTRSINTMSDSLSPDTILYTPGTVVMLPDTEYLATPDSHGLYKYPDGRRSTQSAKDPASTIICITTPTLFSHVATVCAIAKEAGIIIHCIVTPTLFPSTFPQEIITQLYQTTHRFVLLDWMYDITVATHWYSLFDQYGFPGTVRCPDYAAIRSVDRWDAYPQAGFDIDSISMYLTNPDQRNHRISRANQEIDDSGLLLG